MGCPWFGDGLGDLIGHRDYVPCKISCCGITLWQIGAYKEYLEVRLRPNRYTKQINVDAAAYFAMSWAQVGTQAAAAVTQTQVVTQVTTTGAVVRRECPTSSDYL